MSDNTELVAEARRNADWAHPDQVGLFWRLADALEAAGAATVEARRIAEQYRARWLSRLAFPPVADQTLPRESPSEAFTGNPESALQENLSPSEGGN